MLILAPVLYFMHIVSLKISMREDEVNTKLNAFDIIIQLFHFMIGALVQESNAILKHFF